MQPSAKKKILVADSSQEWLKLIVQEDTTNHFYIKTAAKGSDALKLLDSFKPDLVIVELMLPENHGIEILKKIKNSAAQEEVGVILTDYHIMLQNYNSALHAKADYFVEKPCPPQRILELARHFFDKTLPPAPSPKTKADIIPYFAALPPRPKNHSYLKFWGTRGSNPVSGSDYVQFGGNTPCLEIRHGQDLVIIDAGTGIRGLGQELSKDPLTTLHLLFSHTHLDHLAGLPFFYPLHQADHQIDIWAPVGFENSIEDVFSDLFTYAYFPVSFQDIRAKLLFHELRDSQTLHFGSITVSTHYSFHPGSTLCFKIEINDKKIGYVTDNEFLLGCQLSLSKIEKDQSLLLPYASFIAFFSDCDILVHEAQYTSEEYKTRVGWGHSSIEAAAFLIKQANIKHWIVTHHDPRHTDSFLLEKKKLHEEALKKLRHTCLIQFAHDGMLLSID